MCPTIIRAMERPAATVIRGGHCAGCVFVKVQCGRAMRSFGRWCLGLPCGSLFDLPLDYTYIIIQVTYIVKRFSSETCEFDKYFLVAYTCIGGVYMAEQMFSDRLKELMQARRMTQTALADQIGVTQSYVSALRKGQYTPSRRTLNDIAAVFGVSPEWLLTGVGDVAAPVSEFAPDVVELVRLYSGLSIDKRQLALKIMCVLAE